MSMVSNFWMVHFLSSLAKQHHAAKADTADVQRLHLVQHWLSIMLRGFPFLLSSIVFLSMDDLFALQAHCSFILSNLNLFSILLRINHSSNLRLCEFWIRACQRTNWHLILNNNCTPSRCQVRLVHFGEIFFSNERLSFFPSLYV